MPQIYSRPTATVQSPLDKLVQDQQKPLYSISTIFPFRLFPTKIAVDQNKVDIIDELFFNSKHIHGILIQDIANVVVETSLFFATLTIHDRLPLSQPVSIEYLPKEGAMKMRRIIEGLLVGDRANVDTTQSSKETLVPKLEAIGRAKSMS